MKPYLKLARGFGTLIAQEDYMATEGLLTEQARLTWSAREMQKWSEKMRSYGPGPFT